MLSPPHTPVLFVAAFSAACGATQIPRGGERGGERTHAGVNPSTLKVDVELVDKGHGKRRIHHYRFLYPQCESLTLSFAASLRARADKHVLPTPQLPKLLVEGELCVRPQRGAHAELLFHIFEASIYQEEHLPPVTKTRLRRSLRKLRNDNLRFILTQGGQVRPWAASPVGHGANSLRVHLQQSLPLLFVTWPAEAIGQGARWRVKRTAEVASAKLAQVDTFTLQSSSSETAVIEVRSAFSGAPQPLQLDSHFEGALLSLTGSRKGQITIRFNHPVPVSQQRAGFKAQLKVATTKAHPSTKIDLAAKVTLSVPSAPESAQSAQSSLPTAAPPR